MSKRNITVDKNKDIIVDLYVNKKMSCKDISKIYSVDQSVISNRLHEWGIRVRTSSDRCNAIHSVDVHYFDSIDTESKAYFLGLIASDGHVSKNGIHIGFCNQDAAILNALVQDMKSTHPISNKSNGLSKVVVVASKMLADRLFEIGLNSHKSYGYDFYKVLSHVPHNLKRHFVRGLFDGDGCFGVYSYPYLKKPSFYMGFTHSFEGCSFVKAYLGFKPKEKEDGNGIYTCYSRNHSTIVYAGHMMYDEASVFIQRKRELFLKICKLAELNFNNTQNLQRL